MRAQPQLWRAPCAQVAVTYIPAPSFILFCQLSSCAAYVKLGAMSGLIEAEGLEWGKSKKFALIVFGFIGTLFSNVTSLRVRAHPSPACSLLTRTSQSAACLCTKAANPACVSWLVQTLPATAPR